ncbi:MAG: aminotransferase class I/II-fold pyridoxal phosphate-dependent enzyme [Planctomycetes bacterium]|nr:aminotransferase class I/II-fold pyridoxal phosphate-dependent enzyme [Planctomycetota bacterium]
MRAAMFSAELGDDVLEGDPTVRALERAYAAWVGKAGALYLPSGTMANQIALGAWTHPGEEFIAERSSHVVQWEAGGAAALHGLQAQTLIAPDGRLEPTEVERAIRMDSIHCPRTTLLCVEQTFMGDGEGPGGRVVPLAHLATLAALARAKGLHVHMDGARLPNAIAASGVSAARHAACADSVMTSLSKGLGAPVGAMLAGPPEFLVRAKQLRKRFGGWMRQAGVIAAGGLYGLEHHLERLKDDHALARSVAEICERHDGLHAWPNQVETNIVMVQVARHGWTPERLTDALAEHGVLTMPMSATSVRFVTHLDVGPADVERLERALAKVLG